ncbi:MAG: hypothetical protein Aureis2KO_11180 [Aureisphaera sp.]
MSSFSNIVSKIQVSSNEKNILELIEYSRNGLSDDNIACLAKLYAKSGHIIKKGFSNSTADIASTGGPTSLSTLITPLFLKSFGFSVPKLGVPGRPAGGIDILHQIKGYEINPKPKQIKNWLENGKYVHFIGGDLYAPLDRLVFDLRKKNNALGIPDLVMASILSKKIVVNINYAGLDIRVSSFGNFGKKWGEAKENGERFLRVASYLNIQAKCFLTNGDFPYQPFIGRGEALLAMYNIFENNVDSRYLINHFEECYSMAASVANINEFDGPNVKDVKDLFKDNLEIQGTNYKVFVDKVNEIQKGHIYKILSPKSGFLRIDLEKVRYAIVDINNRAGVGKFLFPDLCGVILEKMPSELVKKDDVICSYRCPENYSEEFRNLLMGGIELSNKRFINNQFEEIN